MAREDYIAALQSDEAGKKHWLDEFKAGTPKSQLLKFLELSQVCESPIEKEMLLILLFCKFGHYKNMSQLVTYAELMDGLRYYGDNALIIPQAHFYDLGYRVDFLIILNNRGVKSSHSDMFVVECDGHDFHERTKEQAARDRKRDRDIQALGVPVLRFTGSEIYNMPEDCLQQIDEFGASMLKKIWGT